MEKTITIKLIGIHFSSFSNLFGDDMNGGWDCILQEERGGARRQRPLWDGPTWSERVNFPKKNQAVEIMMLP